ncbi:hypothetical protein IWW45_006707 [Coemansia sp. RSA 485]|nr:hypothetical protein IWW45_006707 [Coemansia sp. RSA 485]
MHNVKDNSLVDVLAEMFSKPRGSTSCRQFWLSTTEKRIIRASAAIRQELGWETDINDDAWTKRWREQSKAEYGLTDAEFEYAVEELKYYSRINTMHSNNGYALTGVDMVWRMDLTENDSLSMDMKEKVAAAIESIPDKFKDWSDTSKSVYTFETRSPEDRSRRNSSSHCRLLHLVDPSLYPLVYDKTPILSHPTSSPADFVKRPCQGTKPGSSEAWKQAVIGLNRRVEANKDSSAENSNTSSEASVDIARLFDEQNLFPDAHIGYCWLPSDIHVHNDGSVKINSYINNLHPIRHASAYQTIAKAISKCLPLLEQTLTDLVFRRCPRVTVKPEVCIRETLPIPTYDYSELHKIYGDCWQNVVIAWKNGLQFTEPVPDKFVEPSRPHSPFSLNNTDLQVFVKLTNVYLTPETPECIPEPLYANGTNNERIVATSMYFYDVDNVEDIEIDFREANDKYYYESDIQNYFDHLIYGVSYPGVISDYVNEAGKIRVSNGSLICYPNIYERRFGTCKLADKSRSGHIKMLTIYFVDPSHRIVSTSIVPPQQPRWSLSKLVVTAATRGRLPEEIQTMIANELDRSTTYEEAGKIRDCLNRKHVDYNKEYSSWRPGFATKLNASSYSKS